MRWQTALSAVGVLVAVAAVVVAVGRVTLPASDVNQGTISAPIAVPARPSGVLKSFGTVGATQTDSLALERIYADSEACVSAVVPGQIIRFLLGYRNTGRSPAAVPLFVALPEFVEVVPASVRWFYRGGDGIDYEVLLEDEALFSAWTDFGT